MSGRQKTPGILPLAQKSWLEDYDFQEEWPDWRVRFKKDFDIGDIDIEAKKDPDDFAPGTHVYIKDSWTGNWHASGGMMDHWLGRKATILTKTSHIPGNTYRLKECPGWVFTAKQLVPTGGAFLGKKNHPLPTLPL